MSFLSDFKAFAMRGNVLDLSVAVVIGTSFGKIVSSLVDGVLMPVLGFLSGGIDVSDKVVQLGEVTIKWGHFLQSVIDFTIISFAIFMAIKLIHVMHKQEEKALSTSPSEVGLLEEIRDLLKAHHSEDADDSIDRDRCL
ncbi:MAG: large-conductance mechanosensitive channel protein MscL [Legionellaceae bacterium]|jgi:large conductance mechanosensitive channel|nr:large-conductance mechanosensitive channel protein MscL [Legionellaceae bacterium]